MLFNLIPQEIARIVDILKGITFTVALTNGV